MFSKLSKFFSLSSTSQGNCPILFLFGRSGSGKKYFVNLILQKLSMQSLHQTSGNFQRCLRQARELLKAEVILSLTFNVTQDFEDQVEFFNWKEINEKGRKQFLFYRR